jgi:hypothetical protein
MTTTTAEPQTHPILGFLRALDGALDKAQTLEPVFMSAEEKRLALVELTREQARLEALTLRVLAAADLDDVGAVDGSTSTGAWLAHATNTDTPQAHSRVRLAAVLDRHHPATAAGLAAGAYSAEHARIIIGSLDALPDDLSDQLLARAEEVMVLEAARLAPAQLRLAGKHLLEVIAPDLADELLRQQLERDEARAYARVRFTMRPEGEGSTQGWFQIPDLHAGILKAALDAITAPRKTGDRIDPETGHRIDHATLAGQGFCELLEHLPTDRLPEHGRTAATIVITLSHDTLTSGLGAAGLVGGVNGADTISAGQARRLACNAGLIPAVLGTTSAPLDLGRETRLFTQAQHHAMALRDRRCRAETCQRPPAWCEAHHEIPWSRGGKTNLNDGVLLCGHHHRLAHHTNYDHQRLPNGDIRFTRRT